MQAALPLGRALGVFAIVGVVAVALASLWGASFDSLVVGTTCALLLPVGFTAVLLRRVPAMSLIEVSFFGFAVGTAILAVLVFLPGPSWVRVVAAPAVVLVVAIGASLWPRGPEAGASRSPSDVWPWIGALVGVVGGTLTLAVIHPLASLPGAESGLRTALGDAPFFETLASGLVQGGWADSGLFTGIPIRYHTLTYFVAGQVDSLAKADAFVVQLRILPVLCLILLSMGAAAWAWRLRRSVASVVLAPVLLLVADWVAPAGFEGMGGEVVKATSLSSSLSSVWLLGAVWLVVEVARRSVSLQVTVATLILAFAASGGKTSAGAIVAASAIGAVIWVLSTPSRPKFGAVAVLIGVAAIPVLTFILLALGQTEPGLFKLWDLRAIVTGFATDPRESLALLSFPIVLIASYLPRWSGAIGWRERRPGTEAWVALACVIVASLAAVVFDETSVNKQWFPVAASVPLSVLAAVGISRIWGRYSPTIVRWRLAGGSLAVALLVAAMTFWGTTTARPLILPFVMFGGAILVAWVAQGSERSSRGALRRVVEVAAVPLTAIAIMVPFLRATAELTFDLPGPRATLMREGAVGSDRDEALLADALVAGSWLRGQGTKADVVAAAPMALEGLSRSLWATSLSGLRGLAVGSPGYFPGMSARWSADLVKDRLELNADVFQDDTGALAEACGLGTRWLWRQGMDSPPPASWGAPAFTHGSVAIWRAPCPR